MWDCLRVSALYGGLLGSKRFVRGLFGRVSALNVGLLGSKPFV